MIEEETKERLIVEETKSQLINVSNSELNQKVKKVSEEI